MLFHIDEKEDVCCNCKNYVQHYVKSFMGWGFDRCNAGHCTYPRNKDRKPGTKACEYFEGRE